MVPYARAAIACAPPTLNIILYRIIPESLREKFKNHTLTFEDQETINQINEKTQRAQFENGEYFVSQTRIKDDENIEKVWLRFVIMNFFEAIFSFIINFCKYRTHKKFRQKDTVFM